MSTNYWRNRWIAALVHNGVKHSVAEDAYARTYSKQSADYSKSPEIQAFMTLDVTGGKLGSSKSGSAARA